MAMSHPKTIISFTLREREVIALLTEGRSNDHIGRRLAISERTVRFHLCNIFSKLGVQNRAHAVSRVIQFGLIGSMHSSAAVTSPEVRDGEKMVSVAA